MKIQVKDFMSAPVTTAKGDDIVYVIKELMNEVGIHAVPVIAADSNEIRGLVTTLDLNNEAHQGKKIEDVMSTSLVHVVHTDSSAQAAAKMMLKHRVHHLVVMDEGEIKGMLSSIDFVKIVAESSNE